MIDLELSWRAAAVTAAALGATAAGLRLAGAGPRAGRRPGLPATAVATQETALLLGLFALWQFAGSFAVMGPEHALARSRWIWHAEHVLHLPSETTVQQAFLPHPLIVQVFNLYYAGLHFPVLIACMIWLFVSHREDYKRLRTTVVALTGCCLLVQLIPVAPPRMMPATHMVDTAIQYGQSVYATHAGFQPDQLSAMPSVHVGWAILVAIAVIGAAGTAWRWLALLYPAMTSLVVVVTANHFWLDGIVAAAILGVVLLLQRSARWLLAGRARPGQPADSPIWHDRGDNYRAGTAGTGGSDGHSSPAGSVDDRATAGRDRPA